MASPVSDSYSAVSGGVIAAGRYQRPAWRRALSANTWGEIPATLLSSIDPKDNPLINPNYPRAAPWNRTASGNVNRPTIDAVMTAWCGGAFDDSKSEFWLPLNAGHSDSADNGSRKIGINKDAPTWEDVCYPSGSLPRLTQDGGLPSVCTPQDNSFLLDDGLESTGVYADGRPRATHSYGKHVHVPGLGIVMALHAGSFSAPPTPSAFAYALHLDEVSKEWVKHPTSTHANLNYANSSYATYDPTRGCIYLQVDGTASLLRLDLDAWTYSPVSANVISSTGYTSNIYIEDYDVCFQSCAAWTNKFCIKDVATGLIHQPTVTGTAQAIDGAAGQCWVPGIGMVFVIGKALWKLVPTGNPRTDPWAWSELAATNASLPTDTSSGGPWTKVGYSKKLGGIYRFTNASSKPWFYATE